MNEASSNSLILACLFLSIDWSISTKLINEQVELKLTDFGIYLSSMWTRLDKMSTLLENTYKSQVLVKEWNKLIDFDMSLPNQTFIEFSICQWENNVL